MGNGLCNNRECRIVLTVDNCYPSVLKLNRGYCRKCANYHCKNSLSYKNKRKGLITYHHRTFRRCPYCIQNCKRNIQSDGRNKGFQRTCGSKECVLFAQYLPEVIAKKRHSGSSHPLWIENRSKVKFRPRYELTIWTREVFKRDNFICQECGQRGGRLQAHHLLPYAGFPDWRWDITNGLTLCIECHKKTTTYGQGVHDNSVHFEGAARISSCPS